MLSPRYEIRHEKKQIWFRTWSQKVVSQKKMWIQKFYKSNYTLGPKYVKLNLLWDQNDFPVRKMLDPKTSWSRRKIWIKNHLGSTKSLVPKLFFVKKKHVGSKNKIFESRKKDFRSKILGLKNLCLKLVGQKRTNCQVRLAWMGKVSWVRLIQLRLGQDKRKPNIFWGLPQIAISAQLSLG